MDGAPDLVSALERFGHSSFRPGQREAIDLLLDGGKLLLIAPTGGGKSLTYQLPASVLPGTTLVVSPLIALMHDQVASLERVGIAATYLASTLSHQESDERYRRLANGDYDLVYVAPERLAAPPFKRLLDQLDCPLVAIDEAHCISEWGHDFRPEYMAIGSVLTALPKARVLACTATATPIVRDEILSRLGLPANTPQIVRGFARENLSLRAQEIAGRRDRDGCVDTTLAQALREPGAGQGTAIVYSPTRKMAEEEAGRLAERGWDAACYHAGLAPTVRSDVQQRFIEGELEIVVATNAFGMGIDRADVRAVLHLGPPGSLEAYYQEVGRAGRDGEPAVGLLLHTASDFPLRRRLLELPTNGEPPSSEILEHKWNLFLELMRWADSGTCRHDTILRYFGDEEETVGGCGVCDVCAQIGDGADADAANQDPEEVTLTVRKALSAVARINGRFGLSAAICLALGKPDPRLERTGLQSVTTFGVLSERSEDFLKRLMRRLVTAGWVGFEGGDRPVAVLTESGLAVMRNERPARILLPGERKTTRTRSRGRAPAPSLAAGADAESQALFDRLRGWRLERAREDEVPPYVVAADRTLWDIAINKPATKSELLGCHGVGQAKLEKYGAAILEIVALPG